MATADGCGPSASTRASARQRNRTSATGSCSPRARRDSRSRSTFPPSAATTRSIRWRGPRSARSACRCPTSRRPRSSSAASTSRPSRPRSRSTAPRRSSTPCTWRWPTSSGCRARSSREPSRTTSSRSTSRAGPGSSRSAPRCALSRTRSSTRTTPLPGSIPSASRARTCATPARPPWRRWPTRWPTASPTWRSSSAAAATWTKFAKRLSFFFYVHMDFFDEVAKFRAGRRLWARLMKERHGATDPKAQHFRFGVVCGGSSLVARPAVQQHRARRPSRRWPR